MPITQPSPFSAQSNALEVRLLGVVDFDAAQTLQEWLIYEQSGRTDRHGVLLLCEHPPIISMGREASRQQLALSDEELAKREIEIRWVSRGGGAVLHAPGQLAIYPIIPLGRNGLSVADYEQRMLDALVAVCHDLRVPAKQLAGQSGLWSRGGQVGQFGATVKSWVTSQGAWLNIAPHPDLLQILQVDAVAGDVADPIHRATRWTSLQAQLLRRIPMSSARAAAIGRVSNALGYDTIHTFTGHPKLIRTRRRVRVGISS
ncbi:MAG: hypothetical protein R3B90_12310 [Planctomycetaceae bacterium]